MTASAYQLQSASELDDQLELTWRDNSHSHFHTIWLRDNCRCQDCGDPAIGYRKLRLTELDLQQQFVALTVRPDRLDITWADGHQSSYHADWLIDHAYDDNARRRRAFTPRPWDDALRREPPRFDYSDLVDDDAALLRLLQKVRDHGICFVHRAPARAGVVEAFSRRFGIPQESNFGRVQDLVFDPGKHSIGNDVKALKPHTDEPYRASPPGILLFHCIRNDQTGAGTSSFVDGFQIAANLRSRDAEGFRALCNNVQPFRRHLPNDVDLIAEFSVISTDEFGNICGVRINDRVAAPLSIAAHQIQAYYRGLQYLLRQSENPALMLNLNLQPGDIAIFDNHRVLHGRSDLTIDGQRCLQWVQIERGDFHSSLRIFADRLGQARGCRALMTGAYSTAANGSKP